MSRTINRVEWSAYVHAGQAFAFSQGFSGVASTVNFAQIWNPAGSKVRIVIFKAELAAGATCQTQFAFDATQFITSITGQVPVNLVTVGAAQTVTPTPQVSKAIVVTAQPANGPSTAANVRRSIIGTANSKDDCNALGIVAELGEGMGFDVFNNTQNVLTFTTLWWAEVPIAQYPT